MTSGSTPELWREPSGCSWRNYSTTRRRICGNASANFSPGPGRKVGPRRREPAAVGSRWVTNIGRSVTQPRGGRVAVFFESNIGHAALGNNPAAAGSLNLAHKQSNNNKRARAALQDPLQNARAVAGDVVRAPMSSNDHHLASRHRRWLRRGSAFDRAQKVRMTRWNSVRPWSSA